MLFDAARRHPAQPLDLPLWSGLRLQALAQLPTPARSPIGGPTVAVARAIPGTSTVAAPLREAETALIRQAVQDARGNVAEAARALGISRATVYRKLGAPKG
ncbi:Bacterial regulatory protein, Fis family [compost metagenome]